MKTLISTLILGAGLAGIFSGCENINSSNKEDKSLWIEELNKADSIHRLKSIDSIALDNSTSIKITKEGFNQYNNGLLIREVKEDYITENFYNNKNQKIKSIGYDESKNEKTGREKIEKNDSTLYEYNDKGQLIKTKRVSRGLGFHDEQGKVWGWAINSFKYDEQGRKIEEKTDENGMIYLHKYEYDKKGRLIKDKESYWNNHISHTLYPNEFVKIFACDTNSDGLIDIARKGAK